MLSRDNAHVSFLYHKCHMGKFTVNWKISITEIIYSHVFWRWGVLLWTSSQGTSMSGSFLICFQNIKIVFSISLKACHYSRCIASYSLWYIVSELLMFRYQKLEYKGHMICLCSQCPGKYPTCRCSVL